MAPMKRDWPLDIDQHSKRARVSEPEPPQFPVGDVRVVLNPADCDIDFTVKGNGLIGSGLHEDGFAYCWSGARSNVGVTRGKYYFGCKVISRQQVITEEIPLDQPHLCRVGISRGDDSVRNLGETPHSFGFGGTGKLSNSGNFVPYGEPFEEGDIIVCYVDLESRPMASISFSKNGKWLGVAKHFDAGPSGLGLWGCPSKRMQWESALFPHVLLKNMVVQLQFTIDDGLIPEEGFRPWAAAILDGNAVLGPSFSNPDECEVIMMVGLPASGKTTWAERYVMDHPEKRYVLLGTNLAMEQMKVPGLLRKHNYGERFDRLMYHATMIFNTLLTRASKIPRNFIIDQTNVYKSARKRKLNLFSAYIKIAVVVFPRAEVLKSRADKRFQEMGKAVPAEAVNGMLANYTLPTSKEMPFADEYFDQVWFTELNRTESQRLLDEMKRDLQVNPSMNEIGRIVSSPLQSYNAILIQNRGVGRGNEGSQINESHGTVQSTNAYNRPDSHFRYFPHGVTVDPGQNFEPCLKNLPSVHNVYSNTFPNSGRLLDLPYSTHSPYHLAPPFEHGSYGTQIPSHGSSPGGMQHANPWRPPPILAQPPHGSFSTNSHGGPNPNPLPGDPSQYCYIVAQYPVHHPQFYHQDNEQNPQPQSQTSHPEMHHIGAFPYPQPPPP